MDIQKYLSMYLEEGREHLAALRRQLQSVQEGQGDAVQEMFRHAHSLKGMAASMGFETTSGLSHALEDLLNGWRKGSEPTEVQVGIVGRALDLLDSLLDRTQDASSDDGVTGVDALLKELSDSVEGRESPAGTAPSPRQATAETIRAEGVEAEAPPEKTATLCVYVDPSSPMPAARLIIVTQRISIAHRIINAEPPLTEFQKGTVRAVRFTVPFSNDLKALARQLKELPDIIQVELEVAETAAEAGHKAPLVQSVRVMASDLDNLLAATSELLNNLNLLDAALPEADRKRHRFWLEAHRSLLNRLFDQVLSVRLVPFETLTQRVERTARELSSRLGKPLRFETTGADQMVDRNLLERLLDPLTHLVRNAVDHGLESPKERTAAGKTAEGLVTLSVRREEESLLIDLSDDGMGLDLEKIRKTAVEKGIVTHAEASALGLMDILEIITEPSFSTKEAVTEVSGRGVGLDVVRSSIEKLGGRLEVSSNPGAGCVFTLLIPSAVTLTEVLVFGAGNGSRFAVPTSQVLHLYPLAQHPIVSMGGKRFLQAGEELVPILPWRSVMAGREGCGVRIASSAGSCVLLVPAVFQCERVIIQPLGPPLEMVPDWIGSAHLSTGHLAYVLDGRSLVKRQLEQEGN